MRCDAGASCIHMAAVFGEEECCSQDRSNMEAAHLVSHTGGEMRGAFAKTGDRCGCPFSQTATDIFFAALVHRSGVDPRTVIAISTSERVASGGLNFAPPPGSSTYSMLSSRSAS